MKFYDYLIEKGKEDGIEKNVVGAVIVNEKNEVLIMSRKVDDFMGGNSDYIKIAIPPDAGFTIEQVEAAADACGQSVQEWVKEAIKDNL